MFQGDEVRGGGRDTSTEVITDLTLKNRWQRR